MPALVTPNAVLQRKIESVHLVLTLKHAVVQLRVLDICCCDFASGSEVLLVRLEEVLDVRGVTHEVHFGEVDPDLSGLVDGSDDEHCVDQKPDDATHIVQESRPEDHPAKDLQQAVSLDLLLSCSGLERASAHILRVFFLRVIQLLLVIFFIDLQRDEVAVLTLLS